jgi:hypothetical protein
VNSVRLVVVVVISIVVSERPLLSRGSMFCSTYFEKKHISHKREVWRQNLYLRELSKFKKFIFEDISMQCDFGRDLYNP